MTEIDWGLANCALQDTEAFYENGDPRNVRRNVCNHCPIKQECREHALKNEEEFGVWGGLTPRQRLAVLRVRYGIPTWRWSRASVTEEFIPKYCPERHLVEGRNVFIDHRGCRICRTCYEAARVRAEQSKRVA